MDIQQSINLYLMKEFQAHGIDFAFPTMTLNLPEQARDSAANSAAPAGKKARRPKTDPATS
jgi:small-conductance mechanosensitive channel